jgi:hypothetical protein
LKRRPAIVAAVVAAVALGAPSGAQALQTIMQDDAMILHNDAPLAIAQMRRLGADRVRMTVGWLRLTRAGDQRERPAGFDAANPASYDTPAGADTFMSRLDTGVRLATANGMKVLLDLGFAAPLWATSGGDGSYRDFVTDPDPDEFAAFATAMARRYSGKYTPPGASSPLPLVDVFELWNEANTATFLRPQYVDGRPASPDWYRSAVLAAYPAVKRVRPDATVLIGATAPSGNGPEGPQSAVGPLDFVRRMACVDNRLRPVTDGSCANFQPIPGDGFSHHPYGLSTAPGEPARDSSVVGVRDLSRLTGLLSALVSRGRIAPRVARVWVDEFGYESNRPVRNKPWTPAQQARLLAQAEYIVSSNRHVVSYSQFLLRDTGTPAALAALARGDKRRVIGSWQSGLYLETGQPKPAARSFRLTLLPLLSGRRGLILWGNIRPARHAVDVRIQVYVRHRWRDIRTSTRRGRRAVKLFRSSRSGMFDRRLREARRPGRTYRLLWRNRRGARWEASPATPARRLTSR